MTPGTPTLEERLRTLSTELCATIDGALRAALAARGIDAPPRLRPVLLTSNLGLDKSLASRVVRALGQDDAIRALHGIPTPQGLALIERAATESGVPDEVVDALRTRSAEYADLLSEFSGGRSDLEAVLAGWIPEQRARAERDARRSVFRGLTTLVGTRTSALYHAVFVFPSEDEPDRADSVVVAVRQDLRRLREGVRVHVLSIKPDGDGPEPRRTTLDGEPLGPNASALLLDELCSQPTPRLEVVEQGDRLTLDVADGELDVNEFTTLGVCVRTRGHFRQRGDAERPYERVTARAPHPTDALVTDVFLHADLAEDVEVLATVHSDMTRFGSPRWSPSEEESPTPAPAVVDLDAAPSGLSSTDVRSVGAIAENVCREAGLDLAAFRKFRARLEFPLPTEEVTVWWRVPGAGGS